MRIQDLVKILNFYGRFTPSFTKTGYLGRGLFIRRYSQDFAGQRWLVTGASGGIGKAILMAAVKGGAEVVAVARSEAKLQTVMGEIPANARERASYRVADMSLQADTEQLRDQLLAEEGAFDVLINNVGVLFPKLVLTAEGREATFVTNLLSHYILTEGLAGGDKITAGGVVINMTSGGMYNSPISTSLLNVVDESVYNGKLAYGAHKRGQAVLTAYWNAKFRSRKIDFYVMHPGWTKTQGVKDALPVFYKLQNLILRSPYQGGETALWLVAVRPPTSEDPDAGVWFDHKLRPAHMFEISRTPHCTVDEYVAFLDAELQRKPAAV